MEKLIVKQLLEGRLANIEIKKYLRSDPFVGRDKGKSKCSCPKSLLFFRKRQ